MNNLADDGLPVVAMRQGWISMAPAIKELERAIVGRKLQQGGHPALRWCFENIALNTDSAGDRSFTRENLVTELTAPWQPLWRVARASAGQASTSHYEAHDLRFV